MEKRKDRDNAETLRAQRNAESLGKNSQGVKERRKQGQPGRAVPRESV
jgi:hypothetical protein